ncbi:MAG: 30S ribosomal protein S5, partial [Candidatus Diapherotrites archaeon]|nr:30S ribosomal protein S5 [Candidatus Diapherotrites archaeon]
MYKKRKKDEAEEALERVEGKKKILEDWIPSTGVGKKVKNGEINSLDQLFGMNLKLFEPEIVDYLLGDVLEKLVEFKKTARVTRSGRSFSYRAAVLVGDGNSYVGIGTGKDVERFPAIKKATRNAKLGIAKVIKGCGSWECTCSVSHSLPFKVEGSSSSIRVVLIPAPKGTGLVVGDNIKDVLKFAGVKDAWSKTFGNTRSKLDFVQAAVDALSNTTKFRVSPE